MNNLSRRRFITTGLAAAAGVSGLGALAAIAHRYRLVPPDSAGIYGAGATLTYASLKLLTRHSMAREFSKSQICAKPFANYVDPPKEDYKSLEAGGFIDWRLIVDGLVDRPASFSIEDLKRFPKQSNITMLQCEEGWSYIAEWAGASLSHVLKEVGAAPNATFVVYRSIQPDWWDSIDMSDAVHPQTLLAYEMNGTDLTYGFGAPLRMRVPRQLGYKSVKYINRLTVTDDIKKFGKGLGSSGTGDGYSWFAGV